MILCNICDDETDEWYEIPCRYGSIDTKGRKRRRTKDKQYICVNCWMAIEGAVQKERGQKAIFEEIYRKGAKEWNEEWQRTHKLVCNDDGCMQLVGNGRGRRMTVREFSDTYSWGKKSFIGIRTGDKALDGTLIWDAIFTEDAKDYLIKAFGDCEIDKIIPGAHLFMDIHGVTIRLSEKIREEFK